MNQFLFFYFFFVISIFSLPTFVKKGTIKLLGEYKDCSNQASKVLNDAFIEWKYSIENSFRKIYQKNYISGALSQEIENFYIVESNSFNLCYTNHFFLIHHETLNILGESISTLQEEKLCLSDNDCREKLLSFYLSHEIAHSILSKEENNEEYADLKGHEYFLKVYNNEIYNRIVVLSYNKLEDNSSDRVDPFLSKHGTIADRYYKLVKDKQLSIKLKDIAEIEKLVDNIKKGKKLESSIEQLEERKSEKNSNKFQIYNAIAYAWHKRWLSSASASELKLKPYIDIPHYHEFGLSQKQGSVDTRIPGDRELFKKAKGAYKQALNNYSKKENYPAIEELLTTYYTVLVYEDKEEAYKKAEELLNKNKSHSKISLNNLAIVYYLSKKKFPEYYNNILFSFKTKEELSKTHIDTYRSVTGFEDEKIILLNYCLISTYHKTIKENEKENCKKEFPEKNFGFSKYLNELLEY